MKNGFLQTSAGYILLLLLFCGIFLSSGCISDISLFPSSRDPLKEFTISGDGPEKVLLIPITGAISLEPDINLFFLRQGVVQEVVSKLRMAEADSHIQSVVLLINSPGGSAYGSEQIWHEVRLLKQQKPVIASMGDYAASGGYYISCAADSIIAQATTLTGSIGIFGIIPNLNGLADKIGVNFDIVKTNRFSDFAFPTRQMTDEEKNIMQMNINQGYRLFIQRCAEGRGMAPEAIEKVAEGRVWTGAEAQKLGLVDQIGGIDLAIATASSMAGIDSYTILEYPEKKSFLASIMEDGIPQYLEAKIKEDAGYYYECLHFIRNIEKQDRVQARLPFYLRIQ